MRLKQGALSLLLVVAVAACGPLGPAPTPTLAPQRLADAGMQSAALAAVQDYARRLSYPYRNASFAVVGGSGDQTAIHATVAFQTRAGFPYEDHDTLFIMRQVGGVWQADVIQKFAKLDWEVALDRGPLTLKSAAGFTVAIPAGWVGHVAPEGELKPAGQCGVGVEPRAAVLVLLVMPAGYSADNVPMVLRGFQQCPKAPGLTSIRQRIEAIRDSDKSITFERLDVAAWGGQTAILAVMREGGGTLAHDYYVIHRERQLEFVVQSYTGQDTATILSILNSIKFN